jgi:hypothetical protein
MATDLPSLLERVEKATGSDRELDHDIWLTFCAPKEWFGSQVESTFRQGDSYGFSTVDGYRHLNCIRPATYTASLDAVLALVEEKGFKPGLCDWGDANVMASVGRPGVSNKTAWVGYGFTPQLAFLSALLSALIGEHRRALIAESRVSLTPTDGGSDE